MAARSPHQSLQAKGRRFRPLVERLEDRLVPAGQPFVEIPVSQSVGGTLTATLIAKRGTRWSTWTIHGFVANGGTVFHNATPTRFPGRRWAAPGPHLDGQPRRYPEHHDRQRPRGHIRLHDVRPDQSAHAWPTRLAARQFRQHLPGDRAGRGQSLHNQDSGRSPARHLLVPPAPPRVRELPDLRRAVRPPDHRPARQRRRRAQRADPAGDGRQELPDRERGVRGRVRCRQSRHRPNTQYAVNGQFNRLSTSARARPRSGTSGTSATTRSSPVWCGTRRTRRTPRRSTLSPRTATR